MQCVGVILYVFQYSFKSCKNGISDVELIRLYPDVDGEVWGAER